MKGSGSSGFRPRRSRRSLSYWSRSGGSVKWGFGCISGGRIASGVVVASFEFREAAVAFLDLFTWPSFVLHHNYIRTSELVNVPSFGHVLIVPGVTFVLDEARLAIEIWQETKALTELEDSGHLS